MLLVEVRHELLVLLSNLGHVVVRGGRTATVVQHRGGHFREFHDDRWGARRSDKAVRLKALGAGATGKEMVVNAMQRIRRRLKERNVESQLRRRLVVGDKG